MADLASLNVIVYGRVQGVYFRAFTTRHALELGLTGYVRNSTGGKSVEVQVEGERDKLEQLITYLKKGPLESRVDRLDLSWAEYSGLYSGFNIRY
jgi:acylphosphatase